MSEEELEELINGLYNNGEVGEYIEEVGTPDDSFYEDISEQLNTTNYILAGITFFLGLLVGIVFIKILWERIK